jgi:hypothetical protein
MLIPSTRVVFEGLSREYYARQKSLAASKFNGCVRLVFPDFEGVIFFSEGRPVNALEECGQWMAMGDEFVSPLENKATVTDGTMAIYELSTDLLGFFAGRKISGTVETETGPSLSARALVERLVRDRSACIFKVRGQGWIGYEFIGGGRVINATYASEKERLEAGLADSAIRKMTLPASAAIYFLEGGIPSGKEPVEVMHPPVSGERATGAETVTVRPAPTMALAASREAELKVVTVSDGRMKFRHPSRVSAMETLEDRSVAWVDSQTLAVLGARELDMASLMLPSGRSQQVLLLKADLSSATGHYLVLPRKLRRELSLGPGAVVVLKPGSGIVARR